MSEPALIVSQSGRITDGLPALASAQGYEPVETLVTDRPEDGKHYLSPATVEDVEQHSSAIDSASLSLVVDGTLHPGQVVDLQARLPSVSVRDTRGAVWERLGGANPVAAARFELRQARVARRAAAGAQRDDATRSPTGTSGRLSSRDRQTQERRAALQQRQEAARKRVETGYTDVDGHVVLLGRVAAPTTDVWAELTHEDGTPEAGRPAQPTTTTTTLGPHTLAVTDTPGVPGDSGFPDWVTAAVPGLTAALERATCVLGVGENCESLGTAVEAQFDATWWSLESATAEAARDALRDVLETAEYALRLPYDDAAHALVSELHDEAAVHATEYDDAIYLRVEVARTAASELRRRTAAVGGAVEALDVSE